MFRFNLEIPFIKIYTETMRQAYELCSYTYIAWYFEIWKWHFKLYWGKSKLEQEEQPKRKETHNE